MATVKKMKKAQMGKSVTAKKKAAVDSVPSEMFPGKMIPKSQSNYENGFNIATGLYDKPAKKAVKKPAPKKKTMKNGGKTFPDLNKDGKITKADILKGRGVIRNGGKAKSGTKMKSGGKCKMGC